MFKLIKFVLLFVFLILGAGFAIINDRLVPIDLYFVIGEFSLSLVLLAALGAGILLGGFASVFYLMGVKKENADLKRKTRLVREEVNNLRALPIKDR